MTPLRHTHKGFIALISAILISGVLMGMLYTVNRTSFYARFDALDHQYREHSRNFARSCINEALLKLAKDYSYDPNDESFALENGSCQIRSVTPHAPRTGSSTDVIVSAKGTYKEVSSDFYAKATVLNPAIRPTALPFPENIVLHSLTETAASGP